MELVQSEGETEGRRERQGEEGMAFRVTRHTPRNLRSGQRRVLTPESSLILSGKRMKLDHASASVPATSKGLTLAISREKFVLKCILIQTLSHKIS